MQLGMIHLNKHVDKKKFICSGGTAPVASDSDISVFIPVQIENLVAPVYMF